MGLDSLYPSDALIFQAIGLLLLLLLLLLLTCQQLACSTFKVFYYSVHNYFHLFFGILETRLHVIFRNENHHRI